MSWAIYETNKCPYIQYFGHLMQRANSPEKTLMLGKIEGKRRRGWQRMRWLGGITDSMDMSLSKLGRQWKPGAWRCYSPWGCEELDTTQRLNNSNNRISKQLNHLKKNLHIHKSHFLRKPKNKSRVSYQFHFIFCCSVPKSCLPLLILFTFMTFFLPDGPP